MTKNHSEVSVVVDAQSKPQAVAESDFISPVALRFVGAFSTWGSMMQRCLNPLHTGYRYYGARGIRVCERWRDFANFLADMGPRPDKHTLDRIDVNGNYEPRNCRWLISAKQQRNTRRNIFVVGDMTQSEAAKIAGVTDAAIRFRRKRGYTNEELLLPRYVLREGANIRKLKPADVAEIRVLLAEGVSCAEIARRFSVSRPLISDIKRGIAWRSP